ncbi:MAG TPA: carboxypeptidase M32 [Gaiellaceae bacterium]
MTVLEELKERLAELHDLERVAWLLAWDEETKMPSGGAEARAEARATMRKILHERCTDPELGRLLEKASPLEQELEPDSDDASLIRVARRDFEKAVRVPAALQAEMTRSGSRGYRAWLAARERDDYGVLLPHLERSLELRLRYIDCFGAPDDPYDVLLDDFEPGMKTAEVEAIFAELKPAQLGMVAAVAGAGAADSECLTGPFPVDGQRRFSLWALQRLGFEPTAWRLDDTVHPFESSPAIADIRLTTNLREENLGGVMACFHEFGHGLYDRQIDPALTRTPLADGVSAALHESQSRLWENMVCRSLACWRCFYPRLQADLPEQLGSVPLETFHRALNQVQPSLIRVEADEVTYNLHIVLRFELERDVLTGRLALRDLPEAFDAKLEEYLGLRPPDLKHGVLQDVHWSDAAFGYFPTYALGNVIGAQIWERAVAELGDLDEQFERGEFGVLRDWLRERVHRHGRKFTPRETLERAVGRPIDAAPYLVYLQRKLGELYGVGAAS